MGGLSELPDLDEFEGGFLFGCGPVGGERPAFVLATAGLDSTLAVTVVESSKPHRISGPRFRPETGDRELTDHEWDEFCSIYGFKPAEIRKDLMEFWNSSFSITIPAGTEYSVIDLSPKFPGAEYVHLDAIRSVLRLGGADVIEVENFVRTVEAFEALRRQEA